MLTFRKWTKIAGYSAAFLLFSVLALIFFDMVMKQAAVETQVVKIKSKSSAKAIDVWRISFNGKKRYRLKADSMDKKKNGVIVLHNAQLWFFETSKPVIYVKADRAVIYPDNNVYAAGNVFLKRKDLKLYADTVFWNDKLETAKSDDAFRGVTNKSSFKGKSFMYYQKNDKLIVYGDNIWLK